MKDVNDVDPDAIVTVTGLCARNGIIIDDPEINDENFRPVREWELDKIVSLVFMSAPVTQERLRAEMERRGLVSAVLQAHIYEPGVVGAAHHFQRLICMESSIVRADGATYFPCLTRDSEGQLRLSLVRGTGEGAQWGVGDVFMTWRQLEA